MSKPPKHATVLALEIAARYLVGGPGIRLAADLVRAFADIKETALREAADATAGCRTRDEATAAVDKMADAAHDGVHELIQKGLTPGKRKEKKNDRSR